MAKRTVNEQLLREAVNHAIDLRHYGNGVVIKMLKILNRADTQLSIELSKTLPGSLTETRLKEIIKSLKSFNNKIYDSLFNPLADEIKSLSEFEAQYHEDLFKSVLPMQLSVASVTASSIYAAAMARPFQVSKDGAVPIRDYLSGLSEDRSRRIRDAIRLGYLTGETIDQIVNRVIGTKSKGYEDGAINQPRHYVEGMVRTAVNHTANVASLHFFNENASLLKGFVWVSTLDSHTTPICRSRDGQVFPLDGKVLPPAHIGCRSSISPVVKSWRELGIDLPEFGQAVTRASVDGQVPAKLTYQTWLKEQSAARQDDILGPTRGKLFRAGATVQNFVDNKGKSLTIERLRERHEDLFKKAGL